MTMLMMMMIMMMMMMMMMTLLMLMMQAEKQKSEVLVQCQKIVTERDEAVQGNKFLQSKLREAEIALKELGQNVCNRQHSQISNAFGRSSNLTWVKLLTQPPIISGMQMSSAYGLWGEGLVWLIGVVLCLLAALGGCIQGHHLSGKPGKPGNVREFETCQGKNLVMESVPKLFITR